jgi:predicted 2-oxoglutarate/Fe(II)-dependent dioxygenase YbiX|tara:strand:- start:572 stop:1150 length:579 start_codon:yes stop_codon:yes gene_type:complete
MYNPIDMSTLKANPKFRWFVERENFFSQEECDDLKKVIDTQSTRQNGYYKDTRDDEEHQSACVINIKKTDDSKLLDKFWMVLKLSNIRYWNYDIQGIYRNRVQAHRYDVGDHYLPHADFHWMDDHSTTKLTCIIFLNDDYEGGEFKFFDNHIIKPKTGKLVIHPAVAGHEVMPVTKGARYSCVAWGVGDTFV